MEGNNLTNTYDIGFKASTAASLYVTIYRFSPVPGDGAMAMGVDLDKAMVMARGHGVMGQEGMVHGGTDHGVRDQRNQRSKYPPVTGPLPSSLKAWSPLRLPPLLLWVSAPPGVAPELTSLLPWHLLTQGKKHLHMQPYLTMHQH